MKSLAQFARTHLNVARLSLFVALLLLSVLVVWNLGGVQSANAQAYDPSAPDVSYTVYTANVQNNWNTAIDYDSCPAPYEVLGGSCPFWTQGPDGGWYTLQNTYTGGNGYHCLYDRYNSTAAQSPITITIQAACSNTPLPNYTVITQSVTNGGSTQCPSGYQVLGGACLIYGGTPGGQWMQVGGNISGNGYACTFQSYTTGGEGPITVQDQATCYQPQPPTCSVWFSQNPINAGGGAAMYWNSTYADNVYINNYGWAGTSGAVWVAPGSTTDYSCTGYSAAYGWGSQYSASLTVNQEAPTCSVSISPNPSAYAYSGTPVTVSWSSSHANNVYINNVGWAGTSGSIAAASQQATDYSCYGWSSAYGDGSWTSASLTVNPPPSPSVSISANPTSVQIGQSSTITATFAPGSGDNLTDDTINIGSTSVIPSSTATTRTYTFTPSSAGTTTFLPYIMTSYYNSWNTWGQSVNVTATQPAPSCTLSASPTSITQGNSTTLSWSCQNATSCTGTNFTTGGATSGSTSVSPTQTTTYTGSCTGPGGTSGFNGGAGVQVPVSCTESWSCSGETIVQTNTDCSQTDLSTCVFPQFCESGSNECLYPAITFNPSGNYTGNLQVIPTLVQPGGTVQVYWNVANAQSCTVTGTNGDSWSGLASPTNGKTSNPITAQTTYTLSCTAYGTNPNVSETQVVNITPVYREL